MPRGASPRETIFTVRPWLSSSVVPAASRPKPQLVRPTPARPLAAAPRRASGSTPGAARAPAARPAGEGEGMNALNVPEGSVVVSAGGRTLTENTDYTVDYTLGRVRIINQGILESGTPISVSLESNELFAIQQKNLIASRFDYKFNDDLAVGGTIMRLSERPITQKVNIGNEPMANVMWGADFNYKTESQFVLISIAD